MPFGIVANYYLVDVSPANGSTEVWIGSHKHATFADCRNCTDEPSQDFGIRFDRLEERQVHAPPIQPVVKKGSVVLRDLRLWHAGLSNPSADPRIMLAFVHTPWVSPHGRRSVAELPLTDGTVVRGRRQSRPTGERPSEGRIVDFP